MGLYNPLRPPDSDPVVAIPLVARDLGGRDAESLGQLLLRQPERDSRTHEPAPDMGETEQQPEVASPQSLVAPLHRWKREKKPYQTSSTPKTNRLRKRRGSKYGVLYWFVLAVFGEYVGQSWMPTRYQAPWARQRRQMR